MPSAANEPFLQKLRVVHQQLADALDQKDWVQMGKVDQNINRYLRGLAERPRSAELRDAERQLQQLHSRAMAACADACEDLRQVLHSHRQHSEGRAAYSYVDLSQGEE